MNPLFPDRPEDLSALTDEALNDLLNELRAISAQLRAGEIDLAEHFGVENAGQAESDEAMRQWRDAAVFAQEIRALQAERAAGEELFVAEAAEIHAAFGDDTADPEAAGEVVAEASEATEPVAEGEAVDSPAEGEELAAADDDPEDPESEEDEDPEEDAETAAAAPRPAPRYPAVPRSHRAPRSPVGAVEGAPTITAASGLPVAGAAGRSLDPMSYAELAGDVARRLGSVQKREGGGRDRTLVATVEYDWPEERTLHARDNEGNAEKIAAAGSPYTEQGRASLVATGGYCAPAEVIYDVPNLSTEARPVRDALVSFRADRGGVSVPTPSTIGDIDDAISVIEAEDDAAGGTFATKSCQDLDCPEWVDTFLGAIAHCREYGNMNSRAWPEGIAHENANTMAAHSRTADGRLLQRIDTLLLNVNGTATYGASSTLLYSLTLSRLGIISRLRLDPSTRFNVLLPFWGASMFSMDLVNGAHDDRFGTPPEAVSALLSRFGFNAFWHLDEALGGGAASEIFEAQSAGNQVEWPGATMIARLYPDGHLLHLDGGVLELGLVRDSDLNHRNDYELFGETFENVTRIGPEEAGHRIAITICPDGTVAAPDTSPITCSAS